MKILKVYKEQIKMDGNAEKINQYVLLKIPLEVFFYFFSVFIQISFPGLTATVMFLVKGFQSEEWMLMIILHYSEVGDQLPTTDENRIEWGLLEAFLFASN